MPTIATEHPPDEQYYESHDWISCSMLKDYADSPAYYHARYITGEIKPTPPTPSMVFGSALHTAVLEPVKFCERYAIRPEEIDLRTSTGKAWMEAAGNRTILSANDGKKVLDMADAVLSSPFWREFKDDVCIYERPYWWLDSYERKRKSKPDMEIPGRRLVVDIKTSKAHFLGGFVREVANYRYHWQAAFYLEMYPPEEDWLWQWIVVHNEPPYEVCAYHPSRKMLNEGRAAVAWHLNSLGNSLMDGHWLLPEQAMSQEIDLPKWSQSHVCE